MTNHPFVGCLALNLQLVEDPEQDTMATNGKALKYNPTYVDSLPGGIVRGLLVHEVLHCASNHMTRRQGRDHSLWNRACDHAINHVQVAAEFQL